MNGDVARQIGSERGAALVMALGALMALSAVAMAVALLATIETRIAGVLDGRAQTLAAASAALDAAMAELALEADWNAVLGGARRSTLFTARDPPTAPGWGPLDLDELTTTLQRRIERRQPWGADTAVWRLYLQGAPSALASPPSRRAAAYAVVWVADDEADGDGRPEEDRNGVVQLWGEAFGSGRARARVAATVRRRASGVELVSWRWPDT